MGGFGAITLSRFESSFGFVHLEAQNYCHSLHYSIGCHRYYPLLYLAQIPHILSAHIIRLFPFFSIPCFINYYSNCLPL